jgi:hypothetical protein
MFGLSAAGPGSRTMLPVPYDETLNPAFLLSNQLCRESLQHVMGFHGSILI